MGMAVAATSQMCNSCNSRTFTIEACQWCGKPLPGYGPREPNLNERVRQGGTNNRATEDTYRNVPNRKDWNRGNDALVAEMELFVSTYNMSPSRFSRMCSDGRDPYLFERITGGGNPRIETIEKVSAFMRTYKTADIF